MKNKTTTHRTARQTRPTTPRRMAPQPGAPTPPPAIRANEFLNLCFYPGMQYPAEPLQYYPTAV